MAGPGPIQSLTPLAVAAIVASSAIGILSTVRVYSNDARVAHTGDVKAALAGLLQAITDAETGQRGYLITGDERYLEPYRRGTAGIAAASESVESLIREQPD